MINEQLMEKVGKDLESIVARDRKARETLDQVKQVAGMGRTIHYNVKIVICAAVLVGLYCLWNVFFRYEDFTIYWIVAIYAYICFVTSLPRLFRMQFRIPDQYELMHLNTLLHQNAIMYCDTDTEKKWVRYRIECKWYGDIRLHVYVGERIAKETDKEKSLP